MATMNGIEKARRQMLLTQEGAAAIAGISLVTYNRKENDPKKMTLGEFLNLYAEYDDYARESMLGWLEDACKSAAV